MNLWNKLRERFAPKKPDIPSGPAPLRNKAGGLAMIRTRNGCGAESMDGQVVKTVRLAHADFWLLEPSPRYITTSWVRMADGKVFPPDTVIVVSAIRDDGLEPLPEVSDDAEDESRAWLPPVPRQQVAEWEERIARKGPGDAVASRPGRIILVPPAWDEPPSGRESAWDRFWRWMGA